MPDPIISKNKKKRKSKPLPRGAKPAATGCSICGLQDGVPYCYDGNMIIVSPPDTGGPWGFMVHSNGQPDWFNAGGMVPNPGGG